MHRSLVLIPAYNEADHIKEIVTGARAHSPVLVVDDGSYDKTASLATAYGASLIRQSPNMGKGAALRTGFRWALSARYDTVVTLDADGQHDPAEIPHFLTRYETTHADLIIGARDFSYMPLIRRVSNTIGQVSFSWALGQPVRDNQSGYRLISWRLMERLLASNESGFEFEVEMIAVCVHQGFSLDWIPIRTIYTGEKSHISPIQHVIGFIRLVLHTRYKARITK